MLTIFFDLLLIDKVNSLKIVRLAVIMYSHHKAPWNIPRASTIRSPSRMVRSLTRRSWRTNSDTTGSGDLVTCDRPEEMYINEGFAEYCRLSVHRAAVRTAILFEHGACEPQEDGPSSASARRGLVGAG